jgi:hypothetical protein
MKVYSEVSATTREIHIPNENASYVNTNQIPLNTGKPYLVKPVK